MEPTTLVVKTPMGKLGERSVRPARLLQSLLERCNSILRFRIIGG